MSRRSCSKTSSKRERSSTTGTQWRASRLSYLLARIREGPGQLVGLGDGYRQLPVAEHSQRIDAGDPLTERDQHPPVTVGGKGEAEVRDPEASRTGGLDE